MSDEVGSNKSVLAIDSRVENIFLWVKITPLGTPVDPDVYMMIAASFLKVKKFDRYYRNILITVISAIVDSSQ